METIKNPFLKRTERLLVISVLILLILVLSSCTTNTSKSYTYSVSTGDELNVILDTTEGYDIRDDNGTFIVTDNKNNTIIQGTFGPEDAFNEYYSTVKGNSEYSVLDETEESFTYVVYGNSGWETNRIIRLKDARTTIIMGSLYEDSKTVVNIYNKLKFEIDDSGTNPRFWDKKFIGIPMKILIPVLTCIVAVLLVLLFMQQRKKRMKFEYYYNDVEMSDSEILNQNEALSSKGEEGDTQYMFENQEKNKKPHTSQSHMQVTLYEIKNSEVQYVIDLDEPKTIGRSSKKSDIVIPDDKAISGAHCIIKSENGSAYIQDAASSNGTWINGERVLSERILENGDILKMGTHEFIVGIS